MRLYIVDAFTDVVFGGNPAGVALLDGPCNEKRMRLLASELRYSETAFIYEADGVFHARYFTPVDEVELCGHATIASFVALLDAGRVEAGGKYTLCTKAGELRIDVDDSGVWMDMDEAKTGNALTDGDCAELYAAFGLEPYHGTPGLAPAIVSTGLFDIIMPVSDTAALSAMVPDLAAISALSERLCVTGVHAFALSPSGEATAYCRNFAPLYGIDEEAATGTSNGALTYYLYNSGLIKPGALNRFIQGESMGRPSEILSRLTEADGSVLIRVGGRGKILAKGELFI